MPANELLIPFFVASAMFACVPGPGMVYAAAQTVATGRRAGWYAATGFHLAGIGHVMAAAFGITMILQVVPMAFLVIRLAGATYLIWIGIRYLTSSEARAQRGVSYRSIKFTRALKDSIFVEALNPKSALFYLAFLPQFTDASAYLPVWAQILTLGFIVNVMFTVTDLILIEMSDLAVRRARASERIALALKRIGGGIFVLLGLNLAFARH